MSGKGNSKASREKRREQVARLYLLGKTQHEIADTVGCSQKTVSNDLAVLRDRWRESALVDVNEAKQRELAKIDLLERTYWQAWEDSLEQIERTTAKRVQAKFGERTETARHVEQRLGDPRYLQGVQWCIERRIAILGANAPVETKHSGQVKIVVEYASGVRPLQAQQQADPVVGDTDAD